MVATLRRARLREQLYEAAERAPRSTVDATLRVLNASDRHEVGGVFAARVLRAIAHLLETSDQRTLAEAASAPSDYAALLAVLSRPEVVQDLQQESGSNGDPLLPARLAGLRAREQLLAAGGGVYTAAQLADLLGVTRQTIDHRRQRAKLLAVRLGRRGNVYPAWQIDDAGNVLDGLDVVLGELRGFDPWTQVAFMLNPNTWLDDETPLAALRRGRVEQVREAASLYGEQVAA